MSPQNIVAKTTLETPHKRVLLVGSISDSDQIIYNVLSRHYDTVQLNAAKAVEQALDGAAFDLILINSNLSSGAELKEATHLARNAAPNIPLAVITSEAPEQLFSALIEGEVRHVFVQTSPFLINEFKTFVQHLLWPEYAVGLEAHLLQPITLHQTAIRSREERDAAIRQAMSLFNKHISEEREIAAIRLGLEEVINNADVHALSGTSSTKTRHTLLAFGRNAEYVGFAVTDYQGMLSGDLVLKRLERQISNEGLLDQSGRGLHLARSVSDRMIITIEPGKLTQVVLLFELLKRERLKPLIINIISR